MSVAAAATGTRGLRRTAAMEATKAVAPPTEELWLLTQASGSDAEMATAGVSVSVNVLAPALWTTRSRSRSGSVAGLPWRLRALPDPRRSGPVHAICAAPLLLLSLPLLLPALLLTYLPTYLPTCLPTYLAIYLPTYLLPTYLVAFLCATPALCGAVVLLTLAQFCGKLSPAPNWHVSLRKTSKKPA